MGGAILACGRHWQPTQILRVVERFQSSTSVVSVQTDDGLAFLKGMGNPAGDEALALELVGCELAAALGLEVPPFAVLQLEGISITTIGGNVLRDGPAFVSKAVRGMPGDPSGVLPKGLVNPEHICRLVAFDTWIRNFDRCPPRDHLDPTPKWDNLFFAFQDSRFRLTVIDHTHAFTEDELEYALQGTHFEEDPRVFGAFPAFERYVTERGIREASAAIRAIDVASVQRIVAAVPLPWGPTTALRSRWCEAIVARGQRIEQYLMDGLIAQRAWNV